MLVFETLVLSVAANVISHYICKWLEKEDPLVE